jgi:tetratricopeptide (TPR) repeat protein
MELPGGRPTAVDEGILVEPSSEGRLILWLPGRRSGGYQHWERVATAVGATVTTVEGIGSIAAASVPVRQRPGGGLQKLLHGLLGPKADVAWTLPGGEPAEECGRRQADLRLAWSQDEAAAIDDTRIKALWPGRRASRAIGPNLYLVSGVAAGPSEVVPKATNPPESAPRVSSRALAESALDAARATGDRRTIITAMADFSLALLTDGESNRAAELLDEARAEAQRFGDPALEADVSSNLAFAVLALGQTGRAQEILGPALEYFRTTGDHYAEKLALDRLATASFGLGDHTSTAAQLARAVAIAAELGDRKHEADLLWRLAIADAELGQRDRAIAHAQSAVDRLRDLGNPTADWYAHHLGNYQSDSAATALAPSVGAGGSIDVRPAFTSRGVATGPGVLRMALTAAKAMAKFVGSGFKTTPLNIYQARLATCAGCEHHTGLRCRDCGCITPAKARLLHERCPVGRWRA